MSIENLDRKLELLPPELQREVVDFVDFLLAKKVLAKKKKPGLNWMDGLKEYRDQHTALELQKKHWNGGADVDVSCRYEHLPLRRNGT